MSRKPTLGLPRVQDFRMVERFRMAAGGYAGILGRALIKELLYGCCQKLGAHFGVFMIGIRVYWGSILGPLIFGNSHIGIICIYTIHMEF